MNENAPLRIAVDTGGTFTDVAVRRPDGSTVVTKVASTPAAPDDAVVDGLMAALDDLGATPADVEGFVHGTTVATNTVLTRTGARVALLTTRGFGDVLRIGHQARPSLYDLRARPTPVLVDEGLTWEVDERLDADGAELRPLDERGLAAVAGEIRAAAPDVVVVAFLNAYADPVHEERAAALLRDAGVAPSVVTATSVAPEMREYERFSTAVVNAYVTPRITGYVDRLERRLGELGVPATLWVMQSNGGVASAGTVRGHSVATVLSGLAGGVVGAAGWAGALGLRRAVSFDIGGTSTDIALIRNGVPDELPTSTIDGLSLRIPSVDVHTIGAGGGSVAWRDPGGGLRVGPRSAGARPGPACYGLGGTEVTVTDAHAVLGRLGESLLGGRLHLDLSAAHEAVAAAAADLGLDHEATAAGILRVINATMARGVRAVSVERGVDVRECTLIAFGGAGPLHAADLVEELGMRGAVIPPHPGIASAVGMLDAPIRHDTSCTVAALSDAAGLTAEVLAEVGAVLDRLESGTREMLARAEGADGEPVRVDRGVDARYLGQSHELTVPWHGELDDLRKEFDDAHLAHHGFLDPAAVLELVTARISATVGRRGGELATVGKQAAPPVARRPVHFAGGWHDTAVHRREDVPAGVPLHGPAVLEQLDSTVVVGPGQTLVHDAYGFAHLTAGTPRETA